MREGVIKFGALHRNTGLAAHRFAEPARQLGAWREILYRLGLVGQDPARYDGAGFGNVSLRIGPFPGRRGARAFLITGTQTGATPRLTLDHYSVVERYSLSANRVESYGPLLPSSESMTHAAIYDLGGHIRCVLHGHCPTLWCSAHALRLPTSRSSVDYGTPEMAREIERLYRATALSEIQVLSMGGHEDGIIAFGRDLEEAGAALTRQLARALALGIDPR